MSDRDPPWVLHVVRRLDFGGPQVGVVSVVRGLKRLGFERAVCCLEEPGELAGRLPGSVPIWSCAEGRETEWIPRRAARWIRTWRPDVVHARNGGACAGSSR